MRCEIFTDAFYHSDTHLEFDPAQVVAVEEKMIRLFLRGKHRVTQITLQSGAQHLLKGEKATKIEAARRQSQAD